MIGASIFAGNPAVSPQRQSHHPAYDPTIQADQLQFALLRQRAANLISMPDAIARLNHDNAPPKIKQRMFWTAVKDSEQNTPKLLIPANDDRVSLLISVIAGDTLHHRIFLAFGSAFVVGVDAGGHNEWGIPLSADSPVKFFSGTVSTDDLFVTISENTNMGLDIVVVAYEGTLAFKQA